MTINFDPKADEAGEMMKLTTSLAKTVEDRAKALEEWDKEHAAEQPKVETPPPAKPRWQPKDRAFVRQLLDKSLEIAEEETRKGHLSLADIFLAQASRLKEELSQLDLATPGDIVDKIIAPYREALKTPWYTDADEKAMKKAGLKRRKSCKSSSSKRKKSKTSRRS